MAIVDILILVALLAFVGFGIWRGFANSLISLCGWLATLIISILLARPFAALLQLIFPLDRWIGVPILNLLSQNSFLSIVIPQTESEVVTALSGAGLPNFLVNTLAPAINAIIPSLGGESITIAEIIAPAITQCVIRSMSVILLIILVKVGMFFLQRFVKSVTEHFSFINTVDRTLGGVFGFVKFLFITLMVFMILTPLKNYNFMDWYKQDVDKSVIGKFMENNNFLASWLFGSIDKFIGIDKVEPDKTEPEEEENTSFVPNREEGALYKLITNKNELLGFDYIGMKNGALLCGP